MARCVIYNCHLSGLTIVVNQICHHGNGQPVYPNFACSGHIAFHCGNVQPVYPNFACTGHIAFPLKLMTQLCGNIRSGVRDSLRIQSILATNSAMLSGPTHPEHIWRQAAQCWVTQERFTACLIFTLQLNYTQNDN